MKKLGCILFAIARVISRLWLFHKNVYQLSVTITYIKK